MNALDSSAPAADGYSLYLRTRSAISSAAYPRRIAYTIAVKGDENGEPRENHYRALYLTSDDIIRVSAISDEELAAPATVPRGINVYIQGNYQSFGRVASPPDLIGVPIISPTYMFGLAYKHHQPKIEDDGSSKLRTIAVVSSQSAIYKVALVGTEVIDGIPTDHLAMTALHDPSNNRLRDLWIDQATYLPVRASIMGNFTTMPMVGAMWTVNFATVDGQPYVKEEHADDILTFPHHRNVSDLDISFEAVHQQNGLGFDTPLIDIDTTGGVEEPKG